MRVKQPQQIFVVRRVLEKQKDALFSVRLKNQTIEEKAPLDVDVLNSLSIDLMISKTERAPSHKDKFVVTHLKIANRPPQSLEPTAGNATDT